MFIEQRSLCGSKKKNLGVVTIPYSIKVSAAVDGKLGDNRIALSKPHCGRSFTQASPPIQCTILCICEGSVGLS